MENNVESDVDADGTKRLPPLEEDELACERVNRQLPSHGWLPIVWLMTGAIVLLLGAAYVYSTNAKQADETIAARALKNTARIEAATRGACMRTQAQRERSNLSDARQYLFFRTAQSNRRNALPIRKRYEALGTTTEYGPPTDCPAAVADPTHYRPPDFILYIKLPIAYPIAIVTAPKVRRPGKGLGVRQPTFKQWRAHRGWWHRQAVKTGVLP